MFDDRSQPVSCDQADAGTYLLYRRGEEISDKAYPNCAIAKLRAGNRVGTNAGRVII